MTSSGLVIRPLLPEAWDDFALLMSSGCGGCWCMWPRVPVGAMWIRTDAENRADMERLIKAGAAPGLLGYVHGAPAAWVSVGPRSGLARLAAPTTEDVFVISCIYVSESDRGQGLTRHMISAAIEHARNNGARMIEAIPWPWSAADSDGSEARVFRLLRSLGFEETKPELSGVMFRLSLADAASSRTAGERDE